MGGIGVGFSAAFVVLRLVPISGLSGVHFIYPTGFKKQ